MFVTKGFQCHMKMTEKLKKEIDSIEEKYRKSIEKLTY